MANGTRPEGQIGGTTLLTLLVVVAVLYFARTVFIPISLAVVFVIFMLLEQEDLRDRVLRIAGARRMRVTTEVLDDAAHRVSRYLLGLSKTLLLPAPC